MKRIALLMIMCLAGFGLITVGSTASAACTTTGSLFKPFNQEHCNGTEIWSSNASAGSNVNVDDDITSSAKNATNNKWCFVNKAFVDSTIWILAPSSASGLMGTENNKTDHFDVVGASNGCPA